MDIMNNMNVSSSKFRFSLLAITALLVIGTGMGANQAFAAAPTFVAIHNSTTTTEIIFSEGVNGTARFIDWHINGVCQSRTTELAKIDFDNLMVGRSKMFGDVPSPVQLYTMPLTVIEGEAEQVKSAFFGQSQCSGGIQSSA